MLATKCIKRQFGTALSSSENIFILFEHHCYHYERGWRSPV